MLYAIVGMLVIILDQGVKYWVTNNIMLNVVTEPLIPGILSLVRLHNDGAAFSFLAGGGARIYFIILTGVFTVAVIIALVTNFISGRFGRWCLVLVTAGGLSNCLDRILYGFVVDMFKVDLFDFAVFNVADVFITVFALLFIIYIIFGGEPDKRRYADEFDEDDDEELDRPDMRGTLRESMSDRKAARTEKALRAAELRAADKQASRRAAKYEYEYEDEDMEDDGAFGFGRKGKKAARKAEKAEKAELSERPSRSERARAREQEREMARAEREEKRAAKGRKSLYEEDYEQFQAELGSRQAPKGQRIPSRPAAEANDPFAAWEKANARYESAQSSSATARAMGVSPSRPAAPAERRAPAAQAQQSRAAERRAAAEQQSIFENEFAPQGRRSAQRPSFDKELEGFGTEAARAQRPAAPAERRAPAAAPVERPASAPAPAPRAAAPAPAPVPAPKAAPVEDEFDLDSILAEFK